MYIDAFNLYYGCLRGSRYRWLDLSALCRIMLPRNEIVSIKYFTARVVGRPNNREQSLRQRTYLRALETLPNLEIVYGHYLSHIVRMPLANPVPSGPRYAEVVKTEEKGSDVNLATHMISDAYEDRFEIAAIITNDSDLLGPVNLVTGRLRRKVGVLNPQRHPAFVLTKAASFFKQIRPAALAASQFSSDLSDAAGHFTKPAAW
ncbi:MAG: NYN domain-containing protein [Gemmatimonas sp.]